MATIITSAGKGSALTGTEYDNALKRETTAKAANYTVVAADNRSTIEYTAAPYTLTLPDASTTVAAEDTLDFQITIKNGATTGYIKIAFDAGDTVDGVDVDLFLGPDESITLKCGSGTDDWMIVSSHLNHDHKNLAYNGDMTIWQDGTSKTSIANNGIAADGWKVNYSGALVADVTRSSAIFPTAAEAGQFINHSMRLDVTTADASIAAGDYAAFRYRIEGYDAKSLGFGRAGIRYLAISFWFRSTINTDTYSVALRNAAFNRSFVREFTVTTQNTWEKKTVIIPTDSDTGATWDYTTGVGIDILITLAAGSTYQTAPDTWTAGNYFATSATPVNAISDAANNIFITGFKVEAGGIPTPFSKGSFEEELAKCQRYYEKSYELESAPAAVSTTGAESFRCTRTVAGSSVINGVRYKVTKATPPATVTVYSTDGTVDKVYDNTSTSNLTASTSAISSSGYLVSVTGTTDPNLLYWQWVADSTLT